MKIVTIVIDPKSFGNLAWVNNLSEQATDVEKTCTELGYEVERVYFNTFSSSDLREQISFFNLLNKAKPDLVFNFIEGQPQEYLVTSILEYMNLKYTGASRVNLNSFNDKVLTKRLLTNTTIPVSQWLNSSHVFPFSYCGKYIIKPAREHNSIGLSNNSIVNCSCKEELISYLQKMESTLGKECFAEKFLDGEEYTVALLNGVAGNPIVFDYSLKDNNNKINFMDYNAKWENKVTAEEKTTDDIIYGYDFRLLNKSEKTTKDKLVELSERTWRYLNLKGYARLDYRADSDGNIYLLEVNVNPCITKTSAFACAFKAIGLSYSDMIDQIVQDGLK